MPALSSRAPPEVARRNGADASDAQDAAVASKDLPMSPRGPLMRPKKASLNDDEAMLRGYGHVSIDSRDNAMRRGRRISVHLDVIMSRDELPAHFAIRILLPLSEKTLLFSNRLFKK